MANEKALQRLEKDFKIAEALENLTTRIKRIINISQQYKNLGEANKAEQTYQHALGLAQNLADSYEKVDILKRLSCLEEARKVIQKFTNSYEKANALLTVSQLMNHRKQAAEVMSIWQEAISVAEAIEDVSERDRTLAIVASGTLGLETHNQALEIAQKITDPESRNAAFYQIICSLPDCDRAISLINQLSVIPVNEISKKEYYRALASLDEPILSNWAETAQVETAYRFSYFPSFHPCLAIRVWFGQMSTPCLYAVAKIGIQGWGEERWLLTEEKTLALLTAINENQFWQSITWDLSFGFDGANWVFEGWNEGNYKLLDAWSPARGPAYRLGYVFFHLLPQNLLNGIKIY
jgi:hypothetical protein